MSENTASVLQLAIAAIAFVALFAIVRGCDKDRYQRDIEMERAKTCASVSP